MKKLILTLFITAGISSLFAQTTDSTSTNMSMKADSMQSMATDTIHKMDMAADSSKMMMNNASATATDSAKTMMNNASAMPTDSSKMMNNTSATPAMNNSMPADTTAKMGSSNGMMMSDSSKMMKDTAMKSSMSNDNMNAIPNSSMANGSMSGSSMNGMMANSKNMMGMPGYASLPVLENYVPADVVTKVKDKYGSTTVYDITCIKHADKSAYVVRSGDNGVYKTETLGEDLAVMQ